MLTMKKKKCPKCLKRKDIFTRLCDCGYDFVTGGFFDSPAPQKKEEAPSASKKKKRATVAEGSGQQHRKITVVEEELPKKKKHLGPCIVVKMTSDMVICPSAICPLPPLAYGGSRGDPWPNGKPGDDAVREWAKQVYEYGIKNGKTYHPDAIVAWSRNFWSGSDQANVREIIVDLFDVQEQ
jgi:hypothetical protein